MTSEADILSAALALPEAARVHVARELLASVNQPELWCEDDPEFLAELQRRSQSIESGRAVLLERDETLSRLFGSKHGRVNTT